MSVQFSYDGQIRRFVMQFVRILSNFQVEFGKDTAGDRTLQTVPVYYGDASRQAAMILRGNSENTLNSVPAVAVSTFLSENEMEECLVSSTTISVKSAPAPIRFKI